MGDLGDTIIDLIVTAAITFGLSCLAVLLFSLQFGFEWSFLLSACVWSAVMGIRFMFGGNNGQG